jgi:carbonic anhydrase
MHNAVDSRRTPGSGLVRDCVSGLVVFLVALPLCLGVALASDAPLFSGIVAGVVGGLIVGAFSGSHTSVSGPAAGLTAVVAAQIAQLGSFEAFLTAVFLAGVFQIVLGLLRAGTIAEYFPSSVIKGLLAAIGVILILKQIPHLVGHDADPDGEMSFVQPDDRNTFSELVATVGDLHAGAATVGLISLAILLLWDRTPRLKKSLVPVPLIVVIFGIIAAFVTQSMGGDWTIGPSHRVAVPVAESFSDMAGFLRFPDFSTILSTNVLIAGLTIALVASLETLLNLEAVDAIDPEQRVSPKNRELFAQGIGNIVCGCIGGLPVTSVIIRSSVNISTGNRTKLATIFHGALLASCVLLVPGLLNMVPLSALAAILLVTGFKLASPKLFRQMRAGGLNAFLPFVATIVAIVFTDLLIGIVIGLCVSVAFILRGALRSPLTTFREPRVTGEVLRIQLPSQVSFLNRAILSRTLNDVPLGGHVLLDASATTYIDPDIQDMLIDFESKSAPVRGVKVSMLGFEGTALGNRLHFSEHIDQQVQKDLSPGDVMQRLIEGNRRFRGGMQISRNLRRQQQATASGQFPMAAVLGCIDSRAPAELIFDLGLGDMFSIRIAGNFARRKVIGSLEYACAVAGSRLAVVLGHTSCGAVTAAVDSYLTGRSALETTGCENIDVLLSELQQSIVPSQMTGQLDDPAVKKRLVNDVARNNVFRAVGHIREESRVLDRLATQGEIAIVGALYDVDTGVVEFFPETLRDNVALKELVTD